MTAEAKLLTLASQSPVLQADLGAPPAPFRWFDKQFAQGAVETGTSVAVLRVSTSRAYLHSTGVSTPHNLANVSAIRFQIDVCDFDPEKARAVALDIIDFMGAVDLASASQFASPPTAPTQYPCFLLNQRGRMYWELQPPAHVESLDWRVFNLETE